LRRSKQERGEHDSSAPFLYDKSAPLTMVAARTFLKEFWVIGLAPATACCPAAVALLGLIAYDMTHVSFVNGQGHPQLSPLVGTYVPAWPEDLHLPI